jgi:hypothetical protein
MKLRKQSSRVLIVKFEKDTRQTQIFFSSLDSLEKFKKDLAEGNIDGNPKIEVRPL